MLFEHYFDTLFRRELSKPSSDPIKDIVRGILFDLHARVGLVLHVRSPCRRAL